LTDQDIGSQRAPEPALTPATALTAEQMPQGHRKITVGLGMLLSGEIVGQDLIKFAWDSVIEVLNWSTWVALDPMPEHVATSIFGLLAAFAFYQTKEKP
jgi:hypothetical protein